MPARVVGGTFLLALLAVGAAPAQQSAPAGLDAFVVQVMKRFEVPGLALTIVKDGQVVVARGYGVLELDKPTLVDSQTTFGIASNTKAFTATALGMLVEDGKLEWDAPVVRYLPAFALSDPYVTSQLTVRDLLVHRSGLGLGAGDLLWWPTSTYTAEEVVHRLRFIPLATSFRSAYAYDNVLYLVAGQVIKAVSGLTWEEFVQSRIITPLRMTDSKVFTSAAGGTGNVAKTHADVEGTVRMVAPFTSDVTNPAGGINASARDMAKWLMAQLDSGRTGTTRIFRPATTRQLWTIVTPIPIGRGGLAQIRPNFNGYALGFHVQDSLSTPSLPLAAYACTYTDAWYGDVRIALEGGKLVLRMVHTPGLVGDLEHWQHDTFVARWRDREMRADAFVSFALNPDNTIDQIKMKKFLNSTDFSFNFQDLLLKRVPANRSCS